MIHTGYVAFVPPFLLRLRSSDWLHKPSWPSSTPPLSQTPRFVPRPTPSGNIVMARRASSVALKLPTILVSFRFFAKKATEVVLSLKITVYDAFGIVVCLFFPWVVLRMTHKMYHWIVRLADLVFRRETREQTPYDESLFRTLEQESRTLASISIGNLAIKATATMLSMMGVIGPTVIPQKVQQLSEVLFVGWVASKIKAYTITRSQTRAIPFILKNEARRFLYNRISDVLIIVICTATCLEILGVPFQSLLAAGGVGGLVVGLAAKELAENIIGGCLLSIVSPFSPGDVIRTTTGGQEIFGRVVRIGWYKTTVLGVDRMPTDVPNQVFVSSRVTNLSRLQHRRLKHRFYLRYADLDKVESCVNRVRHALLQIPDIDPTVGFRVHFIGYRESSLELEVTAFVKDQGIDKFYDVQQLALLEIARVVQESGARLAYPTHAVDIQSDMVDRKLAFVKIDENDDSNEGDILTATQEKSSQT